MSKPFTSESTHWYAPDGTPAYTVKGKNGQERPATLRDARKLGLYPSVTGIIRMMAAPGLEVWKSEQLLMSALTTPRGDLSEKEWIASIRRSAGEQAKSAADKGTEIHAAIERAFRDCHYEDKTIEYVAPVVAAINYEFKTLDWSVERSFASPLGYGGKLDLHSNDTIIDVKTKDFEKGKTDLAYDEHVMQLAAYRAGLSFRNPSEVRCANVFVSRSVPGLVHIHHWTEDDLQRGWQMFDCCLRLWMLKNKL